MELDGCIAIGNDHDGTVPSNEGLPRSKCGRHLRADLAFSCRDGHWQRCKRYESIWLGPARFNGTPTARGRPRVASGRIAGRRPFERSAGKREQNRAGLEDVAKMTAVVPAKGEGKRSGRKCGASRFLQRSARSGQDDIPAGILGQGTTAL